MDRRSKGYLMVAAAIALVAVGVAVWALFFRDPSPMKGKDDLHVALLEGHAFALHHAGAPAAEAYAQLQHRVKMEIGDVEDLQRPGLGAALAQVARLGVNIERGQR